MLSLFIVCVLTVSVSALHPKSEKYTDADKERLADAIQELNAKKWTSYYTVIDMDECAQFASIDPATGKVTVEGACSDLCNVGALTCSGEGDGARLNAFGTSGDCDPNAAGPSAKSLATESFNIFNWQKTGSVNLDTTQAAAAAESYGVVGATISDADDGNNVLFGVHNAPATSALTEGLYKSDPTGATEQVGDTPFDFDDGALGTTAAGTIVQAKREWRQVSDPVNPASLKTIVVTSLATIRESNGYRTFLGVDLVWPESLTLLHPDHDFQPSVSGMTFDQESNELFAIVRSVGNPFAFPAAKDVQTHWFAHINVQTGVVSIIGDALPKGTRSLASCRLRTDEQAAAELAAVVEKYQEKVEEIDDDDDDDSSSNDDDDDNVNKIPEN